MQQNNALAVFILESINSLQLYACKNFLLLFEYLNEFRIAILVWPIKNCYALPSSYPIASIENATAKMQAKAYNKQYTYKF